MYVCLSIFDCWHANQMRYVWRTFAELYYDVKLHLHILPYDYLHDWRKQGDKVLIFHTFSELRFRVTKNLNNWNNNQDREERKYKCN